MQECTICEKNVSKLKAFKLKGGEYVCFDCVKKVLHAFLWDKNNNI